MARVNFGQVKVNKSKVAKHILKNENCESCIWRNVSFALNKYYCDKTGEIIEMPKYCERFENRGS